MSSHESVWRFNKESQIIEYENKPIEMFFFEKEPSVPWFKGKSVTEALEYSHSSQAINLHVTEGFKYSMRSLIEIYGQLLSHPLSDRVSNKLSASQLKTIYVNQYGLYALILRSQKPSAKEFQKWVVVDVLPSIHRSGSYNLPQSLPSVNSTRPLALGNDTGFLKGFDIAEGALSTGKSISAYAGKITVYLAVVIIDVANEQNEETIEKEYVKWGRTDHANDRVDSHVRGFKRFKLWIMLEVKNSGKIEQEFKNRVRSMGIDVGIKVNGKKYKELFVRPENQPIEEFRTLLSEIIDEEDDNDISLSIQQKIAYEKEVTERHKINAEEQTKRHLADLATQERQSRTAHELEYKKYLADQETRRFELKLKYEKESLKNYEAECHEISSGEERENVMVQETDTGFCEVDEVSMTNAIDQQDFETLLREDIDDALRSSSSRSDQNAASLHENTNSSNILAPIRKNRQATRVAEINPKDMTIIAIHKKKEDIKEKYNMCLKTLKKKIDNNEIYLERRWIEVDNIKENHEYFVIIQDFERNVVTV